MAEDVKTKEKILYVATELFAKNGFDETSIRDICNATNVNISLISYYFGGKKELYEKVVRSIVDGIFLYMKSNCPFIKFSMNFEKLTQEEKIAILFSTIETMIDYFYSDKVKDSAVMIIFREQITSGVPLNAEGYNILKKLLASILGKDENDKEIIFKTITIVGQVHAPRVLKQFSLGMMNQSGYSNADIQMLKQIIISQIKAILFEGQNEI